MGLEHEYSRAALEKLIEATEAVRMDADFIAKDVSNLNHADKIKHAGALIHRDYEVLVLDSYARSNDARTYG
jgi:hypothetical protein